MVGHGPAWSGMAWLVRAMHGKDEGGLGHVPGPPSCVRLAVEVLDVHASEA